MSQITQRNESFKLDSSILKIKEDLKYFDKLTFQSVTTDQVRKEILNLDDSGAMLWGDILAKTLKRIVASTLLK